jgi:hypothetical protein
MKLWKGKYELETPFITSIYLQAGIITFTKHFHSSITTQ